VVAAGPELLLQGLEDTGRQGLYRKPVAGHLRFCRPGRLQWAGSSKPLAGCLLDCCWLQALSCWGGVHQKGISP